MNDNPALRVTDDFKRIKGIGPAIERRLHQTGILTFAQLAERTPEEIADLVSNLGGLSAERIAEQDWPSHAAKLAAEAPPAEPAPGEALPGNHQHDISFTVKLLLNEDNSVRRTQVVDNRSKAEEQWAGWDAGRMVAFISQRVALQPPSVAGVIETEQVAPAAARPAPPAVPVTEPAPSGTTHPRLCGTLHLCELEIVPADSPDPRRVLDRSLPFSLRLTLDLTETELPGDAPLNYTATAYAKSLGGGPRLTIGEVHSSIKPKDQLILFVPSRPLPQGAYHVEAMVALAQTSAQFAAEPALIAHREGGIVHVS
jgi:hypothetical protein